MEGSPLTPENDSKDEESTKKKKKAESLGSFVVESKPKQVEEKPSLWEQLTKQPEKAATADVELADDDVEIASELSELTPEETQYVQQKIVEALSPVESDNAQEVEAVKDFRESITVEKQSPEQAFAEKMDELMAQATGAEAAGVDEASEPEITIPDISEGEIAISHYSEPQVESDGNEPPQQPPQPPTLHGGATMPPQPPRNPRELFENPDACEPLPQAAAPMAARNEYQPQYEQGNPAAAALLGGIIGYLIGRRRGRIKTEKKLLPIQKKLAEQVDNLQEDIQYKEQTIRKTARQRKFEVRQLERQMNHETTPSGKELEQKKIAPLERIGHVIVDQEAKPEPAANPEDEAQAPERIAERKEKPEQAKPVEKSAERLNRAELLQISQKVKVEGSTLREMYESHLIGEKGLRRLITEHLRGGDVKKALRREVVEREIDFERDPVMRDQASPMSVSGGGANPTLTNMLKNAKVDLGSDTEEVAFLKARAAYQEKQQTEQKSRQRMVDVTMISTILILAALVAILVVAHH